jgi:hypothetical protein
MVRTAAVLALLTAWLGASRPAQACQAWSTGIDSRNVVPGDGTEDVPTNAHVIVEYEPGGAETSHLELRDESGAVVATTRTDGGVRGLRSSTLTPDADLQPGVMYEVWDTVIVPCDEYCPEGPPTLIARFTTGTARDVTAPAISSASLRSWFYSGENSTCDWDGDYVAHDVYVSVSDDRPEGWLRYLYYDADGVRIAGPAPLVSVGHVCAGSPYDPEYGVEIPSDTFSIRAVDLAGHVEIEAHILVGDSCGGLEIEDDDDAAGCCSTSGNPAASTLLLLALLTCARSASCFARRTGRPGGCCPRCRTAAGARRSSRR